MCQDVNAQMDWYVRLRVLWHVWLLESSDLNVQVTYIVDKECIAGTENVYQGHIPDNYALVTTTVDLEEYESADDVKLILVPTNDFTIEYL